MKTVASRLACCLLLCSFIACKHNDPPPTEPPHGGDSTGTGTDTVILAPPYATPSVSSPARVIGWPTGTTPVAPPGFTVTKFASGLNNPRWLYVGANGDVFLSQGTGGNNILLLRDTNNDGLPDIQQTLLSGQNKPFGMLILNNYFYVGNTDGLWRYPYQQGQTQLTGGVKILDLPEGGYNNHWTRNLIASPDGSKIYVTVGSGSNVAEHGMTNETRRANILQVNPDGTGEKIYASGLRNPVGLAFVPGSTTLWTAVNERDELGDEIVPDYITSVKEGGFYGWPYSYIGKHIDPRVSPQRPDLVAQAIIPDVRLGAHTASLGLAFYTGSTFPSSYREGAFVAQHGSWNSSKLVGYKVIFIPFMNGKPVSDPQDFLTGFIADVTAKTAYGRPVGIVNWKNSLLITDDASNTIWRVSAQ
ncbi:PQQ-dependent sugar dehydrogenase [Deminuibacter soli]|uniref:Sorbosone dehydrogenase family protein n=1 Tax=Deminuibacter soli TaxID=2291815 RepID=A0A3E1NK00_9BACT|nr:sorbosone dehydrogenase family protein [Deminuibacter soli]RFM28260.1 sorbosone dehydrogenase family protein [Deminuibacter soli]